jgi:hypothetical protein
VGKTTVDLLFGAIKNGAEFQVTVRFVCGRRLCEQIVFQEVADGFTRCRLGGGVGLGAGEAEGDDRATDRKAKQQNRSDRSERRSAGMAAAPAYCFSGDAGRPRGDGLMLQKASEIVV